MRPSLIALAVCLLSGCASRRVAGAPEGRQVRLEVPFYPDDTDQCGPSALASVLGYWGSDATPAGLKSELYRANLKGSLTVDLLLAAESRGMTAEMADGGLTRLRTELDAGHPLIAFVNMGFRFYPIGHYLVVTGYDDGKRMLYAHSGLTRDEEIPYATFDRRWEKTRRWTLLLLPVRS